MVTPSGTPAARKPMNAGTALHEQNGVTTPSPAAMTFRRPRVGHPHLVGRDAHHRAARCSGDPRGPAAPAVTFIEIQEALWTPEVVIDRLRRQAFGLLDLRVADAWPGELTVCIPVPRKPSEIATAANGGKTR